jgi:hypothetical protein
MKSRAKPSEGSPFLDDTLLMLVNAEFIGPLETYR